MLAGTKGQTNIRIISGLVLMIIGRATSDPESGAVLVSGLLSVAGWIAFVLG
jgi:hypothetical protein